MCLKKLYSKTIVFNPSFIILSHNLVSSRRILPGFAVAASLTRLNLCVFQYCRGYVRGAGVQVWDPLNARHMNNATDALQTCDMYVTLVPMRSTTDDAQQWRSLTGVAPLSLSAAASVNEVMWYPGCAALRDYWNWDESALQYGAERDAAKYDAVSSGEQRLRQNVICMQEFQMRYNPSSKLYDRVTINAGHWGDAVYEGMKQVINGTKHVFERPYYASTKSFGLH